MRQKKDGSIGRSCFPQEYCVAADYQSTVTCVVDFHDRSVFSFYRLELVKRV
jgi:hypothetical protein